MDIPRTAKDRLPSGADETVAIPAWLLGDQLPADSAPSSGGWYRRRSFFDVVLHGLASVSEAALVADDVSRRPGLLQRLDPRVKLITAAVFIGLGLVATHLATLVCLIGLALVLAGLSRVGLRRFIGRAWTFAPLFTLLVALPAMTSLVSPGKELVALWRDVHLSLGPLRLPVDLVITVPGAEAGARLVLRVTAAVSFAVLLALTTPWSDLLKALRVFAVPRVFVFVIAMAHRYIYLLLRLAQQMVVARRSRTVGPATTAENRRFVGATAAALFGKSQAMSEEVYSAMVARGYTGEVYTLSHWRLRHADALWMAVVGGLVSGLVVLELLLGGTL